MGQFPASPCGVLVTAEREEKIIDTTKRSNSTPRVLGLHYGFFPVCFTCERTLSACTPEQKNIDTINDRRSSTTHSFSPSHLLSSSLLLYSELLVFCSPNR